MWYSTAPDGAKLTEENIDDFVCCLLPAVRMAMFSKFGTLDAAIAFHNLALLRPEVVLPDLLTRYNVEVIRWYYKLCAFVDV